MEKPKRTHCVVHLDSRSSAQLDALVACSLVPTNRAAKIRELIYREVDAERRRAEEDRERASARERRQLLIEKHKRAEAWRKQRAEQRALQEAMRNPPKPIFQTDVMTVYRELEDPAPPCVRCEQLLSIFDPGPLCGPCRSGYGATQP